MGVIRVANLKGQYDSVPYIHCGKEPYSGSDPSKHPGQPEYVEQAGDGIFCMRICEGGREDGDPCSPKNDTAGCYATMGVSFPPGFTFTDLTTGTKQLFTTSLPPLQFTIPQAIPRTSTTSRASITVAPTVSSAPAVATPGNLSTQKPGQSASGANQAETGIVGFVLSVVTGLLF